MQSCRHVCLLVALVGLASGPAARSQDRAAVTPVADHHVHLRSPGITELFGAQIPAVELPADLAALLSDFESRWRARDAAGVAALFTPGGVMQVGRDWQWSPAGIQLALLGRGANIRLHAQAGGADASVGYIAGSYRGDRESPPGDRGRFMFALSRTPDGPWRIAAATLIDLPSETRVEATTVDELIAQFDAAGIRRGALLSWGYQFGGVGRQVTDEALKVRAENDWTAQQAARFPDRLVAFCSLNPLKAYALEELGRCMLDARITGLKLHFTTAGVDLRKAEDVGRVRAVFRAANARRFPIVVHMRTLNPAYGRDDAAIFLNQIIDEAPDTPIHIAHLAGWGGYGPETDAALAVFAQAAASGDPRVRNLSFDLSNVVFPGTSSEAAALIVQRIRELGLDRVLFGIDGPVSAEPWERLVKLLPLDEAEARTLAGNLAPYMRRR